MLKNIFESVQHASRSLSLISEQKVNQVLALLAETTERNIDSILGENQKDLVRMPESDPKFDRLKLTKKRIDDIVQDLRKVIALPSPLGISLEKKSWRAA
ncbi:MAG TPA: hypothetical protein VFW11_02515 [Cyclobacteriaceae bacterium]|nr:hypothetical protein [Cyclobacteriaceae bacterium]